MRKDTNGDLCPETWGEYLDLCEGFMPDSAASELLRAVIKDEGADAKSPVDDQSMRLILMPLLIKKKHEYHPDMRLAFLELLEQSAGGPWIDGAGEPA